MSTGEIEVIDERGGGPDESGDFPLPECVESDPGYAPLPDDYDFKNDANFQSLPKTRRVEILRIQDWASDAIAREVGITRGQVNQIAKNFDDRMHRTLQRSPDEVRGYIEDYYWRIAAEASIRRQAARTAIDFKVMSFVGMGAVDRVRKMRGTDAPERSIAATLELGAAIDPVAQQAMLDEDPESQQLLLALNARRRQLAHAARQGGPGGLRDRGQPREVDAGPAPGGDQQEADGGSLRSLPPPDDLRPAEARQI